MDVEEVVDARKGAFDANRAWQLLQGAKAVTVAKGKSSVRFDRVAQQKEEILKQALGPTGNLRAPTLVIGKTVMVGFSDEAYAELLK